MNGISSPALPLPVLVAVSVSSLLLVAWVCARTSSLHHRFVVLVVWLRIVMQAFHHVTYATVGGLTINALMSLAICGLGALLYFRRAPALLHVSAAIALCVIIALSGLTNALVAPTIETLLRWGYFFVIALAVRQAIIDERGTRVFAGLMCSFSTAILLQLVSIALGVAKASESDGSASYIGGFNHESSFSIVMLGALISATLAPRVPMAVRVSYLACCLLGIVAANYRTTIIAAAPVMLGYALFMLPHAFVSAQRSFVSTFSIGLVALAGTAAVMLLAERMSDMFRLLGGGVSLVQDPSAFSPDDRQLLSGRLYLWNQYFSEYLRGSDMQLLIGSGPDSWMRFSAIYAHNSLVSYLYEYGLIGVLLLLALWGQTFILLRRAGHRAMRRHLALCHCGFILLNMATMPLWSIEGLLWYGLLCGASLGLRRSELPQEDLHLSSRRARSLRPTLRDAREAP